MGLVSWVPPDRDDDGCCSIPEGAVSATFGIRREYVARATDSKLGILVGRASVCDNGDVLLVAACSRRYFSTRFPKDPTVQFLVQSPKCPTLEWLACPSHALPRTAVQCGWNSLSCRPLYAGKSLPSERYHHIGVVDEDLTLNVPVGTGQQPVRQYECEVLCYVERFRSREHS